MDAPEITVEINRCPTHGFVEKDHRCPEFDGVLRDGWTGRILPESDSPADSVKYLGYAENGTQYKPKT